MIHTIESFLAAGQPAAPVLHPADILSRPAAPVTDFGPWRMAGAIIKMAMGEWYGAGLAAPQVGLPYRAFAFTTESLGARRRVPILAINPEVVEASADVREFPEGCLSLPGQMFVVERPVAITARWQDMDGKLVTKVLAGLGARIFLHEMDHLEGKLICDVGRPLGSK